MRPSERSEGKAQCYEIFKNNSGGDAPGGNTRTHPEHDVKTRTAENTAPATVWEDRWLPDLIKKHHFAERRMF